MGWKLLPSWSLTTVLLLTATLASWCNAYAECVTDKADGSVMVDATCIDSLYNLALIDSETDETYPVPHRKVSGHWNGTEVDFNIYLPSQDPWDNRFFQQVYPTQNSTALPEHIAFGAASGGYTVCTSGQPGYRSDAATAKFARNVANRYYNATDDHIYGYIYGGSGGSYQTVGAVEKTHGVWDGAVIIVQAVPGSVVNNMCASTLANLVLRPKKKQIEAAFSPGGSGNPFPDLNQVEASIFKEVTEFGIPLTSWEHFEEPVDSVTQLRLFTPSVQDQDPTYADDFWSKAGYLGTEDSDLGDIMRAALVNHTANVERVEYNLTNVPAKLVLDWVPDSSVAGLEFSIDTANSTNISRSLTGRLAVDERKLILDPDNDINVTSLLSPGSRIRIDNRWHIAMHSYHRHQLPTIAGFYGYDQYRDSDGKPIYPQRSPVLGQVLAQATSGGATHTGNLTMKTIVMDNLVDSGAYPWHADWYKSRVQETMGDKLDDTYRIWFNERSDHYAEPLNKTRSIRLVPYNGIYQQALRDVSAWVERGIPAPSSTVYTVEQSQVKPVHGASARRGVQPTVQMRPSEPTASVNQLVTFEGSAEVPPRSGKIVSVEWDFEGTGDFVTGHLDALNQTAKFRAEYAYPSTGTYYPSVRVLAQRDDSVGTDFCRIYNLARASIKIE